MWFNVSFNIKVKWHYMKFKSHALHLEIRLSIYSNTRLKYANNSNSKTNRLNESDTRSLTDLKLEMIIRYRFS